MSILELTNMFLLQLTHLSIWGSIACWFLFLAVYSHMFPTFNFASVFVGMVSIQPRTRCAHLFLYKTKFTFLHFYFCLSFAKFQHFFLYKTKLITFLLLLFFCEVQIYFSFKICVILSVCLWKHLFIPIISAFI